MYFHPNMIETLRQPDYYLVKTFDSYGLYDWRVHFNYRPLLLYKVETLEANNYTCLTKYEYDNGRLSNYFPHVLEQIRANDFVNDNFLVIHISDLPKILPICAKLCNAPIRPFKTDWDGDKSSVRITAYQQPLD